jgi:tripartite-type tricarboxylate transporter receptor subunit TctC
MKTRFLGSASVLGAALVLPLALGVAGQSRAQASGYPNKPIRLVVGFPAGGASDAAARAIGQKLGERMGQAVIVDNKPGAASNIGTETVVRSPADGYTVLLGTIALSINPSLYSKLSFDPSKDLIPVSLVASAPFILVSNPNTAYKSVKDLISAANADKQKGAQPIFYASAGNGSGGHLFTELFATTAGIKMTHIPYKGAAPAIADVLGNTVPLLFDNIITTLPLIKTGKLQALGVSTKERSKIAPAIPTLAEQGVTGFDATSWFGLFVPAGTPKAIVDKLNAETVEALKDPVVRERLMAVGADPVSSTPAEFDAFFRSEVSKWQKVVRSANVQID